MRQKRRTLARDQAWSDTEVDTIGVTALDQTPAADVALEARQRLERLVEALAGLPPQTQRVFRLHKFEGLTHSETAARLGISRSAVEKHVSTALRHLVAQKR
jgi:RNA polymerase sigma-70 factor (ECF subfamily)